MYTAHYIATRRIGAASICERAGAGVPMLLSLGWLTPAASSSWPRMPPTWRRYAEASPPRCSRSTSTSRRRSTSTWRSAARLQTELPRVQQMVRAARDAVKKVSPITVVLASINWEVFTGGYQHGKYLPFGKLPATRASQVQDLVPWLREAVDAVGISTAPESSLTDLRALPNDYLLPAKQLFGDKPLLLTRAVLHLTGGETGREKKAVLQAVRTLLLFNYWVGMRVVVYPDLLGEGGASNDPDVVRKRQSTVREIWCDAPSWERVDVLAAGQDTALPPE